MARFQNKLAIAAGIALVTACGCSDTYGLENFRDAEIAQTGIAVSERDSETRASPEGLGVSDADGSIFSEFYTEEQADQFPHLIGNWHSIDGTYVYMGGLNSALVNDMISSGVPASRELIINSPGGENLAAITLGIWLRENDISVRVPFSCASACAQFVFVGATSRSLDPGAWVACHQNTIANALILQVHRPLGSNELAELRDARALYEAAGVSEEFALACGAAAEPICLTSGDEGGVSTDGRTIEALRSRAFWIPARSQLAQYGITIEGPGLESASSLHDWDGNFAKERYLFGSSARIDPSALLQVPICSE